MMDKKELVVKPSDQLALAKTNRLLAITNKILARQGELSTVVDDYEEIKNKEVRKNNNGNIDNCKWNFIYECPQLWDNLTATPDKAIKFCSVCKKNVYACYNSESVLYHTEKKHCIAIIDESNVFPTLLGYISPPSEEFAPPPPPKRL